MESKALVHKLENIDIYSCSWGPNDDGKSMKSVGTLTDKALHKGIEKVN